MKNLNLLIVEGNIQEENELSKIDEILGGIGEKEEVIINADSLKSENDELSRKSFDCDLNFVKSKEKYSQSRTYRYSFD